MKSSRSDYHLRNLEEILLPSVNIIGFDAKAAYVCGRLRATLEESGQLVSLADMEIAAIAINAEQAADIYKKCPSYVSAMKNVYAELLKDFPPALLNSRH